MIEKIRIIRSKDNDAFVDAKLKRMKDPFHWGLLGQSHDDARDVEVYEYKRDRDALGNADSHLLEDDFEQVVRAKDYCRANMDYCAKEAHARETIVVKKGVFIALAVIMAVFAILFCIFRFSPVLTHIKFTLYEQDLEITEEFVYEVPEGESFFGESIVTYDLLRKTFSAIFLVPLTVAAALFLIILKNKLLKKSILQAECADYKLMYSDWSTLNQSLGNKWTTALSRSGTFDPYEGEIFKKIEKKNPAEEEKEKEAQ